MRFWDFSLTFYGDDAVQAACLAAQDELGADVNVLLYLLWRAGRGEALDAAGVAAVDAAVAPWRRTVVAPLRDVRRVLKGAELLPDREAQESLRNRIKKVELDSERAEQELLERLEIAPAETGRPVREAAARSLEGYAAGLGTSFPSGLVETFLARLDAVRAG
ncbi:TIGR02444 family protein [Wenxinia marina]|uniref:TIGR02444 family protein n=1 Tax=Wenxinia marina DSM 24838 TaxID=1123501 RepID=A0A0D0QBH6_9RHOB|nr:TIGR02444 family protein [Wenxinia marina]KIQ68283.1 hypothetical protein Wenmar_03122 [Wenxinia marina DSM 24838]GGL79416.1 hypothetical protein GCM10011392_37330 [Wenxinia marina]